MKKAPNWRHALVTVADYGPGVGLEDVESDLREKPRRPRSEVRSEPPVRSCSDNERARRIGDFWAEPLSRTFAEVMIDCEDSPHTRVVVIGFLRKYQL